MGARRSWLRGCFHHMVPQTAGYGFRLATRDSPSSSGMRRLQFIGRVESLADDWQRLLRLLGANDTAVRHAIQRTRRVINSHTAHRIAKALRPEGREWDALTSHPLVRRHLATDRTCLRGVYSARARV